MNVEFWVPSRNMLETVVLKAWNPNQPAVKRHDPWAVRPGHWNGVGGSSFCIKKVGLQDIHLGLSPCPVTVTTRIIIFLVGDPYKPSFATVTGRGDNPIYTPKNSHKYRKWWLGKGNSFQTWQNFGYRLLLEVSYMFYLFKKITTKSIHRLNIRTRKIHGKVQASCLDIFLSSYLSLALCLYTIYKHTCSVIFYAPVNPNPD